MKTLSIFLLVCSLWSCAHTAKVTNLQDLPHLPATVTGMVLPLSLEAEHSASGSDGCILTFVRIEDGRSYETEAVPGQDMLVAELVPGSYEIHDAYCGRLTWDLTHHHFARFLVQAGKLSFLEGLKVYMTGANNMSISESNRTDMRLLAQKFLGRVSEENRARLISGYTGKAIPPPALEKAARWKNWALVDGAGAQIAKGDRQWPSFHSCYRGEEDVNPLWLGYVVVEATYQGGELVGSKTREVWNSFSDQFATCTQAALKEFHPKAKSKLSYTIYL